VQHPVFELNLAALDLFLGGSWVLLWGALLGRTGLGLRGVRLRLRYEIGLMGMGRLSPSEAHQRTARKSGHREQKPRRSLGFHERQTAGLA